MPKPKPLPILSVTCPNCQGRMILRWNKRTGKPFWGCTNFPRCDYTKPADKDLQAWLRQGEAK